MAREAPYLQSCSSFENSREFFSNAALTPLRWDHASRNRVTKRSDGEVQSRKRVAPESGAFGPRFIMLIKDRARRDRMRRLSADSVVSRRDHAGPAQRIAAGGGGGGRRPAMGGVAVALPNRAASDRASAGPPPPPPPLDPHLFL